MMMTLIVDVCDRRCYRKESCIDAVADELRSFIFLVKAIHRPLNPLFVKYQSLQRLDRRQHRDSIAINIPLMSFDKAHRATHKEFAP